MGWLVSRPLADIHLWSEIPELAQVDRPSVSQWRPWLCIGRFSILTRHSRKQQWIRDPNLRFKVTEIRIPRYPWPSLHCGPKHSKPVCLSVTLRRLFARMLCIRWLMTLILLGTIPLPGSGYSSSSDLAPLQSTMVSQGLQLSARAGSLVLSAFIDHREVSQDSISFTQPKSYTSVAEVGSFLHAMAVSGSESRNISESITSSQPKRYTIECEYRLN